MITRKFFINRVFLASFIVAVLALTVCTTAMAKDKACKQITKSALKACKFEVKADVGMEQGNCYNISDQNESKECINEAKGEQGEATAECNDQKEARTEVCEAIGEAPYDPDIDPADFVDPSQIGDTVTPNTYFPLIPGSGWIYEGGDETITVTVTDDTVEIMGVTCVVVKDVAEEDGEVIEDTDDWFAQDTEGNVWYFGEISKEYEDGELVGIEGSWKAGEDGAKPGVLMKAAPQVGEVYRQEFLLGEAEDMGEVLSLTGTAAVPAASCTGDCAIIKDFTPLEPDADEDKYFAPGIGLILEVDNEAGGERVELVELIDPPGEVELEDTSIIFELNATDGDLGIQVFLDGEPWIEVEVESPDEETIFEVAGEGTLEHFGLAELFFESEEPSFDEVPLEDILDLFPAGEYQFSGKTVEGDNLEGTAMLTHNIPNGPVIVSPEEDAELDVNEPVVIDWNPVTDAYPGTEGTIEIIGYQVIVEREEPEIVFSVDLPASVTAVTVSPEFIEADTEYDFEVLAIEASGNQTISESSFTTVEPEVPEE